ncbi:MAG: PAS domain S-box protein [Leptospiraceae bacterium]
MTTRRLLLVEDDEATALLEKRILEKQNYGVTWAATGEQALDFCNNEFDLVLMDIDLGPGMKGTEAARIILQTYDVPVAFLSSHTDRETVELTSGITSYGYILKTAGPVVLLASIEMVFRLILSQKQEREQRRKSRESELRYRQLFALNPLPMWVYETKDLRIINVNDAAAEQFGYSREEFLKMKVSDILHPEERERFSRRAEELRALAGEYAKSGLWSFQKKNQETILAEVFGHGLDFPEREARLFVANDVTQEIAAREKTLRELEEKERLLQEFYRRTRSHIAALEEMLKIRAREMTSEEGTRALLEAINRLAGLRLLYDRLLGGAQSERSPVHYLKDLCRSTITASWQSARVSLETQIEDIELSSNQILGVGAVTVEVMEESLREAFLHQTRGTITVHLEKSEEDIILSISDDGEPWALNKWTDRSDNFGVSVILMVAERLGASIGVEPDQGNRFLFRFPHQEPGKEFKDSISNSPLSERFRKVIEAVHEADEA